MSRITIAVVVAVFMTLTLIAVTPAWGQAITAAQVRLLAPLPAQPGQPNAHATVSFGNVTLYYWVTARYPIGVTMPRGPAIATRTVGVAGLAGGPVVITWPVVAGATGYDVIRLTTRDFPTSANACTNCVVSSNQAPTTFTDAGGGVANWPTAGTVFAAGAEMSITINNRDQQYPFMRISGPVGSSLFMPPGPINVGNAAAPIVMTGLTGSQQAIGARATGAYGSLTSLKGADFRATSIGGAGTFLVGTQSSANMNTGTVTVTEVMGGNFVASLAAGTANQAYGLIGELDVAAPATAPTGNFATGILGVLNNSISIQNPTNHPAAVTGAIFDNNAPAEAGVLSLLLLDNIRATAVGAAFKVVDRTIIAGHGFNYGLDLLYACAPGVCGAAAEANSFNIADVRTSAGPLIQSGSGAPTAGDCAAGTLGSIYLNNAGGAATSLYVCQTAGGWTAVTP